MDEMTEVRTARGFAFTSAMHGDLAQAVLCWLATVDDDGTPNVSPKEVFCAHGQDVLLIANIASPQSRRNIAHNAKVCVSFVDVFRQCGFKFNGQARIIAHDMAEFGELAGPLVEMAGPDFKVLDVFHITVTKAARILAPSYRVFPDRTPEEHIRRTQSTYGVVTASAPCAPSPPSTA